MKLRWIIVAPALALGGMMVGVAPEAAAGPVFNPAEYQTDQGNFALVVRSGDGVTCQQARGVFDDWFAGKGTETARNGATVDGYACTGNPAGAHHESGILSYCEGNGAYFSLRNP